MNLETKTFTLTLAPGIQASQDRPGKQPRGVRDQEEYRCSSEGCR